MNATTVRSVPESDETLAEFADSLSYGSRSDLSFKYLPRFDAGRIGDSLAELLEGIGSLYDTSDPADLIDRAIALQVEGYRSRDVHERYRYEDGPFVRPERPITESTVALLTSSGHFAAGDDPQPLGVEDMSQEEAEDRIGEFLKEEPVLSDIPVGAELRVRHGGYDVRGVRVDHNVAFPVDRMAELAADGVIGNLAPTAYSFVGACAQTRLMKHIAPEWAERVGSECDVVLLVPV